MHLVEVLSKGDYPVEKTDTFEELARQFPEDSYVAACVAGNLNELTTRVGDARKVELIGLDNPDGAKIYQRSLVFLFVRSALKVIPNADVKISHSLSKGLYCTVNDGDRNITHEESEEILKVMRDYVEKEVPIRYQMFTLDEAEKIFEQQGFKSKAEILQYKQSEGIRLYELDGIYNYFYGYMVPNTSYLKKFDLIKYGEGVILMHPTHFSPDKIPYFKETPKMADVYDEMEDWMEILGVSYISNLNEHIMTDRADELILISEALQEKKIAQIADEISSKKKRVILIAGPSSSGKTTFAKRLGIQLRVNGLSPVTIGTDDYFVDREFTPRDKDGNLDFECLEAVDIKLFNEDLNKLLDGEPIDVGRFDFMEGKRYLTGEKLQIDQTQPIIIEGIHGLNDALTPNVFKRDKYKIYISSLTLLNIDEHNRIPTTQARMLRRIVRDHTKRGHSAKKTIGMWSSVRKGEERFIFPFQESADVIFNSALPYELAVLKKYAMPMLSAIEEGEPEYQQAKMLIKFLQYFESIEDESAIPNNSILREFIGGSRFEE